MLCYDCFGVVCLVFGDVWVDSNHFHFSFIINQSIIPFFLFLFLGFDPFVVGFFHCFPLVLIFHLFFVRKNAYLLRTQAVCAVAGPRGAAAGRCGAGALLRARAGLRRGRAGAAGGPAAVRGVHRARAARIRAGRVRGGGREFGKVVCLGLMNLRMLRMLIALVDRLEEVADCTG
jgi:hypothetical protein